MSAGGVVAVRAHPMTSARTSRGPKSSRADLWAGARCTESHAQSFDRSSETAGG